MCCYFKAKSRYTRGFNEIRDVIRLGKVIFDISYSTLVTSGAYSSSYFPLIGARSRTGQARTGLGDLIPERTTRGRGVVQDPVPMTGTYAMVKETPRVD